MSWREQQAHIMTDKVSGAVGLVKATVEMIHHLIDEEDTGTPEQLQQWLLVIAREILTAQSGNASLVALFNQLLNAIDKCSNHKDSPQPCETIIHNLLNQTIEHQMAARGAIARATAALVPEQVMLLTHSSSSTFLMAMLNARRAGKQPRIFCTESRPQLEGRMLAAELAKYNINVTLIIDSAIFANLGHVEMVILGADSLSIDGIVSKIGSGGIAVNAQKLGIPCYFVADTTKIWPASLGKQPIHERAPGDVWDAAPKGVKVQNHFFDTTPWDAVSGVITESGMLAYQDIAEISRRIEPAAALHNIVAEVRSST